MKPTDIRQTESSDNRELREEFDNYLDEIYPECIIANLSYSTSHVLRNIDECAYNQAFNDWLDAYPNPWKCPVCEELHDNEDSAERCCQTECEQCGELYEDGSGVEVSVGCRAMPMSFCSGECAEQYNEETDK